MIFGKQRQNIWKHLFILTCFGEKWEVYENRTSTEIRSWYFLTYVSPFSSWVVMRGRCGARSILASPLTAKWNRAWACLPASSAKWGSNTQPKKSRHTNTHINTEISKSNMKLVWVLAQFDQSWKTLHKLKFQIKSNLWCLTPDLL